MSILATGPTNENNRNIEEAFLRPFLKDVQGYDDTLVSRALFELGKVAGDQSRSLYDVNRSVYDLLRYGVKVRPDIGENTQTVWLIDWANPESNHFAIAEEVTVKPAGAKAFGKRPDIVLYVNGIALGVLELKRSTVSFQRASARTSTIRKKSSSSTFSPPCSSSWRATTRRACATPRSRRPKNIT
jgi:type I restriction enzyme, R subunit